MEQNDDQKPDLTEQMLSALVSMNEKLDGLAPQKKVEPEAKPNATAEPVTVDAIAAKMLEMKSEQDAELEKQRINDRTDNHLQMKSEDFRAFFDESTDTLGQKYSERIKAMPTFEERKTAMESLEQMFAKSSAKGTVTTPRQREIKKKADDMLDGLQKNSKVIYEDPKKLLPRQEDQLFGIVEKALAAA